MIPLLAPKVDIATERGIIHTAFGMTAPAQVCRGMGKNIDEIDENQ